ncbi:nucleotide triphosphate diphosphatase NUDT15 [Pseudomonas aeruginosa]|uniref:nucleotide triphosphate diphosphatase NUDT15 n=1 Tax=Pseudomonas aeruginosa TaxID=287 RepID=UPI003D2CFD37
MSKAVGVGVAVIICRDGKVLVGRRKGSHGEGAWAVPGGSLEFGETVEECARREVLEETGLRLGEISQCEMATNDIFASEGKHFVTLWALARLGDDQEPATLEPHKCQGWEWHPWDSIPMPHFLPLANLKRQHPLIPGSL